MAKPGLPIPVLLVMLTLGACQAVRSSATPAPQPETPSPTASPETSTLPPAPPPTRQDTATILDDLGGSPCPDSEFTCVSLEVPQDHSDPANTQTIEVVFGVLPATGERKGMFVTVVGGPRCSREEVMTNLGQADPPATPSHIQRMAPRTAWLDRRTRRIQEHADGRGVSAPEVSPITKLC